MHPSKPPKVTEVEVVATQPTETDSTVIAHLSAEASKSLPQVAYLVKLRLKTMPPATSQGWALYVGDLRIPKYWEYKQGVYFKVFDPQFFADHKGEKLRFSQNGSDFIDTGKKLTAAPSATSKARGDAKSRGESVPLVNQAEALK
jgi:hypothetical protein